jgi:hypothetical protein
LFDQQLLLAVDGRVLVQMTRRAALEAAQQQTAQLQTSQLQTSHRSERPRPIDRPLAIGTAGVSASVEDLTVWRDAYYAPPSRSLRVRDIAAPVLLPRDGYFLLGDNAPVSDDSRTWPSGGVVAGHTIVGRPIGAR